ncbi:MAG: hypothetical protein VKO39_12445 [Cyanobacteriota bacterium]|nr:hypothetical protein [Cyanobacteriota bacterium]
MNFFAGSQENDRVQRRTLESLQLAHGFAAAVGVDVSYLFLGNQEDIAYLRSLLGESGFKGRHQVVLSHADPGRYPFLHGRSNPSLTDTFFGTEVRAKLADLCGGTQAQDCLIVISNTDICLRPHAYLGVSLIHRRERRASFVINRETLADALLHQPIQNSFSAVGQKHPGHDFFCLTPSCYFNMDLDEGSHLVGFGFVMRPVLANMIFSADAFAEIGSSRLTFHYGDDMPWKDAKWNEALAFNRRGMISVYWRLHHARYSQLSPKKQALLSKFFPVSLVGSRHD